jgi:hypothetical protein
VFQINDQAVLSVSIHHWKNQNPRRLVLYTQSRGNARIERAHENKSVQAISGLPSESSMPSEPIYRFYFCLYKTMVLLFKSEGNALQRQAAVFVTSLFNNAKKLVLSRDRGSKSSFSLCVLRTREMYCGGRRRRRCVHCAQS